MICSFLVNILGNEVSKETHEEKRGEWDMKATSSYGPCRLKHLK